GPSARTSGDPHATEATARSAPAAHARHRSGRRWDGRYIGFSSRRGDEGDVTKEGLIDDCVAPLRGATRAQPRADPGLELPTRAVYAGASRASAVQPASDGIQVWQ